jgi:hypothetical protein
MRNPWQKAMRMLGGKHATSLVFCEARTMPFAKASGAHVILLVLACGIISRGLSMVWRKRDLPRNEGDDVEDAGTMDIAMDSRKL